MSVCVAGILALQFHFAQSGFRIERGLFGKQANEAFAAAFDSVVNQRDEKILDDFRKLISDTSFVRITSRINRIYGTTVFTIAEVRPPFKGQSRLSMSIETFSEQVEPITPEARQVFIGHLVNTARNDLKNGYVFYYTQKLGDSLSKAKYDVPIDTSAIRKSYVRELSRAGLPTRFNLSFRPISEQFSTNPINLSLKTNKPEKVLFASFDDPGLYIFNRLKWVLAGSFLLFIVTVFCFGYTLKVLLSQQKLAAAKDDFINNMTHELHTPLASLTVTAESLKKFAHDDQSRDSYIDIILHQTKRLGNLTSEILETARSGSVAGPWRAFKVGNMVESVISHFPASDIDFQDSIGDLTITGNENDLKRALANIVGNAIKYNDRPEARIGISLKVTTGNLMIGISDNGPGIPDSEKIRIFDAFYRIGKGDRHDVKGYGLGLYFVRRVVAYHGGKIAVKDNSGPGATFILIFPL